MGAHYIVTSGVGSIVKTKFETRFILIALWELFWIKIDNKETYWKELKI